MSLRDAEIRARVKGWAIGAVVAQQLYTLWVGGSNPSSPTSLRSRSDGSAGGFSTACALPFQGRIRLTLQGGGFSNPRRGASAAGV